MLLPDVSTSSVSTLTTMVVLCFLVLLTTGAVDKGVMAEMRANGTEDTVMAYAIDLKDRVDFKLSDPNGPKTSWARYIYGIALEMKKRGVPVKGFNIAFAGDVPLGAGMSSSAAMESCFAYGLNDIFGDNKVSQWDMVLAGQDASGLP